MTAEKTYTVVPYTFQNLKDNLLSLRPPTSQENAYKQHFEYLQEYFTVLGARTIIIENSYVDLDYLEDYSQYYSKCFNKHYSNHCRRLHFLTIALDETAFEDLISSGSMTILGTNDENSLELGYLGFIVVRPLPNAVIGRTCLRTYESEGRRCFPVSRKYEVNLFGIPLSVISLAYQEQDGVVAACATSALWSAFHKTGVLYQHTIPTPVMITHQRSIELLESWRGTPSKGLSARQMSQAIRDAGLEPESYSARSEKEVVSIAYAYNRAGIPVLMLAPLFILESGNYPPNTSPFDSGKWEFKAGHAITITGYSLESNSYDSCDVSGDIRLRSYSIDRIYAHDDQVGPFSRLAIDSNLVRFDEEPIDPLRLPSFACSWTNEAGEPGTGRLGLYHPDFHGSLLVPVEEVIRISFTDILDLAIRLDWLIELLRQSVTPLKDMELGWDIFLFRSNDLKSEVVASQQISNQERLRVVTTNLPKYIWRCVAQLEDTKLFELVFDSTDTNAATFVLDMIVYDQPFVDSIKTCFRQLIVEKGISLRDQKLESLLKCVHLL